LRKCAIIRQKIISSKKSRDYSGEGYFARFKWLLDLDNSGRGPKAKYSLINAVGPPFEE